MRGAWRLPGKCVPAAFTEVSLPAGSLVFVKGNKRNLGHGVESCNRKRAISIAKECERSDFHGRDFHGRVYSIPWGSVPPTRRLDYRKFVASELSSRNHQPVALRTLEQQCLAWPVSGGTGGYLGPIAKAIAKAGLSTTSLLCSRLLRVQSVSSHHYSTYSTLPLPGTGAVGEQQQQRESAAPSYCVDRAAMPEAKGSRFSRHDVESDTEFVTDFVRASEPTPPAKKLLLADGASGGTETWAADLADLKLRLSDGFGYLIRRNTGWGRGKRVECEAGDVTLSRTVAPYQSPGAGPKVVECEATLVKTRYDPFERSAEDRSTADGGSEDESEGITGLSGDFVSRTETDDVVVFEHLDRVRYVYKQKPRSFWRQLLSWVFSVSVWLLSAAIPFILLGMCCGLAWLRAAIFPVALAVTLVYFSVIPILDFCVSRLRLDVARCFLAPSGVRDAFFANLLTWPTALEVIVQKTKIQAGTRVLYCLHPHGIFVIGGTCALGHILRKQIEKENAGAEPFSKVMTSSSPGEDEVKLADELCSSCPPYLNLLSAPFMSNMAPLSILQCRALGLHMVPARSISFQDPNVRGSLCLVPGGFHEIGLMAHPDEAVYFSQRKGVIKHALRQGLRISPIYCHGEKRTYYSYEFRCARWLNNLDIPTTLFFSNWFPAPNRVPLVILIGAGVQFPKIDNPSQEDVDKWHRIYTENLVTMVRRETGVELTIV